jgi:membrane-associated phospholipid phosphatase
LPALLVEGAPGQFEHWLRNRDSRWVWARLAVPKRAAHAFELAYLLCYPLVPIAFLTVRNGGNTANLERFWISVLGAGYVCYATLPWLVSRPPRLLAGDIAPAPPIQRLNGNLLARFSHSFITFPSGHVAVSTAAALTALSVSLPAGIVLLVVSCGVAIAAISGGYHYALDVVLGAFVGIVIAVLSSWI